MPVQAEVLQALQPPFVLPDVAAPLVTKLKATLTSDLFDTISGTFVDFQWLSFLIGWLILPTVLARVGAM